MLAKGLWQDGLLSQLPFTGKQHMWMTSASRRFLPEPSGGGDEFEFRMKLLSVWVKSPQPGLVPVTEDKGRPVASCLPFPTGLLRLQASFRCPELSWITALVWGIVSAAHSGCFAFCFVLFFI
jgi:hypothetical protein